MAHELALSLRQPWAWLVVHGYKDVENRDWFTRVTGRLWIHAAQRMTKEDYEGCQEFVRRIRPDLELPPAAQLERGGLVGRVVLVDCVEASASPWFVGVHGLVLTQPEVVAFRPCPGGQRFFRV